MYHSLFAPLRRLSRPSTIWIRTFTEQRAGAILRVDVDAIVDNYQLLSTKGGTAECAAVVKADAYGLGAVNIVPSLYAAGCRKFFVAHLGEAVDIRSVLPVDAKIMVLNGVERNQTVDFVQHNITPVLNTPAQLALWLASGNQKPAVLHVDTGMARLGLSPNELDKVAAQTDRHRLQLDYVMSHLACADEPRHELNGLQLRRFRKALQTLGVARASFANSAGIFLGPSYHFDLVRPGCALYGINPVPEVRSPVRQVASLYTRVLQVRELSRNDPVGYGASHRVTGQNARIATVALGYADGYLRAAHGKQRYGVVAGHRVPVVGRVSMDLITLDVTAVPTGLVNAGSLVEMLGNTLTVDELAEQANTIGYEVLTSLGNRFHRQHVGDHCLV
eukprot:TRINITY_DN2568_c0_g2_i1.p1 TRINITY_DN2568_c0_g2~~TRINITY_DN2568_c0_g2_i1.p1  ORF type:complete len:390 (-),score=69.84 TRINITY_DN2568_c0_g2_i1:781-1950(-)